jgi:hypothetical protein
MAWYLVKHRGNYLLPVVQKYRLQFPIRLRGVRNYGHNTLQLLSCNVSVFISFFSFASVFLRRPLFRSSLWTGNDLIHQLL